MKTANRAHRRHPITSQIVAIACMSLSTVVIAKDNLSYEQALLPAARTSTHLSLCTHVESYVRDNEESAEKLRNKESQLFDAVLNNGWSNDHFAGALTFVQTQESIDLEPQDTEGEIVALERFFSKDFCQKSQENADELINGALPRK